MENNSIYIHLPFCTKKCAYCDFYSMAIENEIPENEYLQALIDQKNWFSEKINSGKLESIYFGGGTPSLLSAKFYENILCELNKWQGISQDAEISIEVNPESLKADWLKSIASLGVNRVTVGIQSFNEKHLKILGRRYE